MRRLRESEGYAHVVTASCIQRARGRLNRGDIASAPKEPDTL
jgi:hypothetical protein